MNFSLVLTSCSSALRNNGIGIHSVNKVSSIKCAGIVNYFIPKRYVSIHFSNRVVDSAVEETSTSDSKGRSSLQLLRRENKSVEMATNLRFSGSLEKSDPLKTPVTIIGQLDHLKKLAYDDVKIKLEPRVSLDVRKYNFILLNLCDFPWANLVVSCM